ncbi:MAG: ABC transporter permease subunit [Peptococcaceae bacterium]|nr:ABC transporter permease subunit [Peptococcaceae bacterium]
MGSAEGGKARNIFLAVVLPAVVATWFTRFNPLSILAQWDVFLAFFTQDFFPPEFVGRRENLWALLVTVAMSFAASFAAFILSALLSFLGADATAPHPVCGKAVRAAASLLRNMPTLVWAFILFMSFGIGETVGFLALLLSSVGFLTRAFIETIDETPVEIREVAVAGGAGYWQRIFCLILPGVITGYLSWLLYNIELNIRSSSIVGMVGGGGIGLVLFSYLKMYRYGAAAGVILAIAAMVVLFEWAAKMIRKRVLA